MTSQLLSTTEVLSGAALAGEIRAEVTAAAAGLAPHLAVVVATADESTAWYVRSIKGAAGKTGIRCSVVDLGPDATPERIRATLAELSADREVDGIMLQTPLPDGADFGELAGAISPAKDVDGANPVSLGRLAAGRPAFAPATAAAVMALLDHYEIPLAGRRAVVVGRSTVVGKPVAQLLLHRDATVTVCHRHTKDLAAHTAEAEVLVVAVGRPEMIGEVRPGATVIDVGTTATADGGLVGDVNAAAVTGVAGALTPVPGGVGPVTTALLLSHTVRSAAGRAP
ncbi:bifunctional 5,10-methylenetetrahydrofolate dehydrogenase/5,10-methenyltetrahydrofolate cyclohydrolase [Amycolatopsis sp. 195334CR]|uniref:bifunctional 5,10-methylenetetrahydrofolate dehydrogenase/5,10-methenyltetrahydrofolate cyclohydrolase n=1 Tax=Amycolatopsis sp. 195334CR TaxID=2814588 RepID=UPI001A8C102B|nr:bifunctional 5,10-methylenetetrahydrofolate dehydrogenase/5,10-methenyltetrahydrofolate cyclohydrolase [Amycolatopsis sp. 195334CR]MBN6039732.1 bifunctional 5,10-methylenetetrahydrofolate dehydrogenase/5,10-methenyltetrahydrofolate cyclohydrolase [Amycolatopsis sp. 195334CR]